MMISPSTYEDIYGEEKPAMYFCLPVVAIVIITILNDGCILSIAYDKVEPSPFPESWRLPEVFIVSFILGGVACISTLGLLIMCLNHMGSVGDNFLNSFNIERLSYGQVITAIYLKVSVSDFMTVYCARTSSHMFSRTPGKALFVASIVAVIVSTFFAKYWFLS